MFNYCTHTIINTRKVYNYNASIALLCQKMLLIDWHHQNSNRDTVILKQIKQVSITIKWKHRKHESHYDYKLLLKTKFRNILKSAFRSDGRGDSAEWTGGGTEMEFEALPIQLASLEHIVSIHDVFIMHKLPMLINQYKYYLVYCDQKYESR